MSETPTGTDRVELTDAEYDQLSDALKLEPPTPDAPMYYVGGIDDVVASIMTARLQALTAERDELLQQVERLQTRILKADPRPNQPIDDFGGNTRSMYVRVSDGWLRRFDKWRKAKGLSRSGAIRKLVQDAWEADNAR